MNNDEVNCFICEALMITSIDQLKQGMTIHRASLLNMEKYKKLTPYILKLKTIFTSKTMNSLHNGAEYKQKWPFINLVRQVLKKIGYDIKPQRQCAGKDEYGKKKFERYFIITSNSVGEVDGVDV